MVAKLLIIIELCNCLLNFSVVCDDFIRLFIVHLFGYL